VLDDLSAVLLGSRFNNDPIFEIEGLAQVSLDDFGRALAHSGAHPLPGFLNARLSSGSIAFS
jgi:hypothetical protein